MQENKFSILNPAYRTLTGQLSSLRTSSDLNKSKRWNPVAIVLIQFNDWTNWWWLYSLEVQVLESEVCFHNTSSFDSGPQHILLGGHISAVGYPVQVIQVALRRGKSTRERQNERNIDQVKKEERFILKLKGGECCLFCQIQAHTRPCMRVSASNSLCSRVIELVLSGAAETGLNSSVFPQPLDDPGELACHEAFFCWTSQDEQLPRIILMRQSSSD